MRGNVVTVFKPTCEMMGIKKIKIIEDDMIFCILVQELVSESLKDCYYLIIHKQLGLIFREIRALQESWLTVQCLDKPRESVEIHLSEIAEVFMVRKIFRCSNLLN